MVSLRLDCLEHWMSCSCGPSTMMAYHMMGIAEERKDWSRVMSWLSMSAPPLAMEEAEWQHRSETCYCSKNETDPEDCFLLGKLGPDPPEKG
ncbi:hypothetical protein EYF80_022450 [Liparis tanakae]|uniref:Uncharacterized protein n=1 Tax=Liparis tanakae TaxID=230148 RepID=A0A4Z2HQS3_9TELE|nr:hypothetical protein EYF80_022450 [Liparis tanakae]